MARDILAPNAGPLCPVAVGGASIGATTTIGGTLDREEPGGIAAVSGGPRVAETNETTKLCLRDSARNGMYVKQASLLWRITCYNGPAETTSRNHQKEPWPIFRRDRSRTPTSANGVIPLWLQPQKVRVREQDG